LNPEYDVGIVSTVFLKRGSSKEQMMAKKNLLYLAMELSKLPTDKYKLYKNSLFSNVIMPVTHNGGSVNNAVGVDLSLVAKLVYMGKDLSELSEEEVKSIYSCDDTELLYQAEHALDEVEEGEKVNELLRQRIREITETQKPEEANKDNKQIGKNERDD
jgi:hypothetical protein